MHPALYGRGDFVTLLSIVRSLVRAASANCFKRCFWAGLDSILAHHFNRGDGEHYLSKRFGIYKCSIKEDDCLL